MRQNLTNSLSCRKYGWLLGALAKLRKVTISFVISVRLSVRLSVRMEQLCFHWANFNDILYWGIFRKSAKKFDFHLNLITIKGTLHEYRYIFWIQFSSVLLRMRNVSVKCCRESQNTHSCVQ